MVKASREVQVHCWLGFLVFPYGRGVAFLHPLKKLLWGPWSRNQLLMLTNLANFPVRWLWQGNVYWCLRFPVSLVIGLGGIEIALSELVADLLLALDEDKSAHADSFRSANSLWYHSPQDIVGSLVDTNMCSWRCSWGLHSYLSEETVLLPQRLSLVPRGWCCHLFSVWWWDL